MRLRPFLIAATWLASLHLANVAIYAWMAWPASAGHSTSYRAGAVARFANRWPANIAKVRTALADDMRSRRNPSPTGDQGQ